MMSVVSVKPGQMGDSILVTRLQKGSSPLTVHIPTSKIQVSMLPLRICSKYCLRGGECWQCFTLCCRTQSVGFYRRWKAFWRNRRPSAVQMTNPNGGRAARPLTLAFRSVAKKQRSQMMRALSIISHFLTENIFFRNCSRTWRTCWEAGEAFCYHSHQIQRSPDKLSSFAGRCLLKASRSTRKRWRSDPLPCSSFEKNTQESACDCISLDSGCSLCFCWDEERGSPTAGLWLLSKLGRGLWPSSQCSCLQDPLPRISRSRGAHPGQG